MPIQIPLPCSYVNVRTRMGISPLHLATLSGHVEAGALLIAAGANIMCPTIFQWIEGTRLGPGSTPLHMAAHQGHINMCRLILKAYVRWRLSWSFTGELTAGV